MELVWHRGYEDYGDSAWPERRDYLTGIWKSLSLEKASGMDSSILMDCLEMVEELMRYYTFKKDYGNLEPLMRSYEPMLQLLRDRQPDMAGYWYLEMEYSRINALLYLNQGSTQQAVSYFEQAFGYGEHCFSRLQQEAGLYGEEQRFYLAWSCAECRNEMATACERILDSERMYKVLTASLPLLQYMEGYLGDADGICERAAELYSRIGAIYYQYKEFDSGNYCYGRSEGLFGGLAEKLGSGFYRARALWIRGIHGIDAFVNAGNAEVMLDCERRVQQFLAEGAAGRDRAIAEGALAMNYMQRGVTVQQSGGDMAEAIRWTEKSVDLFGNAQEHLKRDSEDQENIFAKSVISDIAARLYSSGIAAMDVLGVQYYAAGQAEEAQGVFEQVLSMLTDTEGYTVAETASMIIRAESCEYLALIAAANNDQYKADFYGVQAMDFGEEAARKSNNPAPWQIVVISASLVSEIAGIVKDRQKMGAIAERGLAACDQLARLMPENSILSMRGKLEMRAKKAKRRFF